MLSFILELWDFLRSQKKYWLLPVFVVLGLLGALVVLTYVPSISLWLPRLLGV